MEQITHHAVASLFEDGSVGILVDGVRAFNFTEEVWYTVKLEASGSQMNVWVDDKKILTSQDSRLQQGELEFAVQYNRTVLLNNVKVFEYVP